MYACIVIPWKRNLIKSLIEIDKYLPGLKDKKIVEVLLLLKFHIHVLNAVFQFD